jgi:intracellular sulfur oxidation DsrE/DsrF family protein
MRRLVGCSVLIGILLATSALAAEWPAATAPVIPQADGYVEIPNAVEMPQKAHVYRAIFDATRAAENPSQLVPALNMAGSELNVLGATGVPVTNAKFVVVFHGPALDGVLDDEHYKAKFGINNPNLPLLAGLRAKGVDLFVCGQNLAFENIDPATLSPHVVVACDALIVLMRYQSDGYALLSF